MLRDKKLYILKRAGLFCLIIGCLLIAAACQKQDTAAYTLENRDKHISESLTYTKSLELDYANEFAVDYYDGEYRVLSVANNQRFFILPEGGSAPGDLPEDMVVLEEPKENIYLVATAVMDMFRGLNAIDTIRYSSQQEDGWYIPEAREAMNAGKLVYAGKYSAPDYEMLMSQGCSLAIQSMMITHSPEIKENLEGYGIPVMIDYSSYEAHPLGRVEWIKFYGALLGREQEAESVFEKQKTALQRIESDAQTNKTVAFFYINSKGAVNVRKTADYIPKMINLAGGKYIFDDLGDSESKSSSMNMQMEEFFQRAKDADYLIYNGTIDGGIDTMDQLLSKSDVLSDFKAVREGNVWCATSDIYQQSMSLGTMIEDIHAMLNGAEDDQTYLYHIRN